VIKTHYELNDTLYAKADVAPTNSVFLWLGVGYRLYGLFKIFLV
jgi:hypothetical protein